MINKSYNIKDLENGALCELATSLWSLRDAFARNAIPYHVDGEREFRDGPRPRFWEYASAVHYSESKPGMRVLDAGSAYSLLAPWLALRGYLVRANDRNPFFRQRIKQFKFIDKKFPLDLYDLCRTGYPDAYFDRIFCISVIEHIPPEGRLRVLSELQRVLKDDGILAVTFDLFREDIPYGTGSFHGAQYCQYFSGRSIIELFQAAPGLELIEHDFIDDTDWKHPPLFGEYNFGRVFLRKRPGSAVSNRRKFPLRSAHVSYNFSHGGIQEQVQIIPEYSRSADIEHVIVAFADGPLRQRAQKAHIPHCILRPAELVDFCKAYNIDVVIHHAINGTPIEDHLFAYDLFLGEFLQVNQHYCSFKARYPNWLFKHIITNDNSTVQFLPERCPTSIYPLSLNTRLCSADDSIGDVRRKWNIPEGAIVIGRLSRLERIKMVEETIKAMGIIRSRTKQPLYFIIGGGVALNKDPVLYMNHLRNLAREHGVEDIFFTGPIDFSLSQVGAVDSKTFYKEELLALLDINLAPSSFEGYGLIFTEPAYYGVPSVTYDHCANKATVASGGIVVPFRDIEALVQATIRLIENPELRRDLGERARSEVVRRNAPELWASNINKVIADVCRPYSKVDDTVSLRAIWPIGLKIWALFYAIFGRMIIMKMKMISIIGKPLYYSKLALRIAIKKLKSQRS